MVGTSLGAGNRDEREKGKTEMRIHRVRCFAGLIPGFVVGGLLLSGQPASAVDNGPSLSPSACMQRAFIGPTGNVTNANRLNCTANDIRLSKATSVSPSSCVEGTTFDLTATFETNVTANARYDAGFFFRTDGGSNARGDGNTAGGVCSLSA